MLPKAWRCILVMVLGSWSSCSVWALPQLTCYQQDRHGVVLSASNSPRHVCGLPQRSEAETPDAVVTDVAELEAALAALMP